MNIKIPIKSNEEGIVPFITVMFLAGILTLITTGFVVAMIGNQRGTLDSQLNTQAFYAAESGVNEIAYRIKNGDVSGLNFNNGQCSDGITFLNSRGVSPQLDPTPISITCLMVRNTVNPIEFTTNEGDGKMYQIKPLNGAINHLNIRWGNSGQNSFRPGNNKQLPDLAGWGSSTPPLLRVTLYYYRNNEVSNINRQIITEQQRTFFLIPSTGAGATDTVNYNNGSLTNILCNGGAYGCSADIDINGLTQASLGVPPGNVRDGLFIRIKPMYTTSTVQIWGYTSNGFSNPADLVNAQYDIDSTGRANDVYKRISVRLDMTNLYEVPDSVVESGNDLCKQFYAYTGGQGQANPNCSY